ncbi:cytochrome o ubiquinol oxidase subunit III [Kaustia mangrovi]|uniref:Cytochrome bo(3) ubiquinol oxidase subunit 3 n=1 Tax=Kaustia mangrovi TaxID=2593653 RepID=A0A7S8HCB8_9HYPH|nr:cytochrome o ubiquinol oxidase subunit III [Kaustia mangrovi]QPC43455.1 cytochrome o ubiquinol oxidase subunit III [Kaustia mangrovi]
MSVSETSLPEAQDDKAFGFWLYLMSDAIIFALLFATYVVMSGNTAGGPTGKDVFDLSHTFAETMLLLFSSVTFGLATVALLSDRRAAVIGWLAVTFAFGAGFVGMELSEFSGMIAEGASPQRSGFLSAFFTLVATHGLHVSAGLVWILLMVGQIAVKGLTAPVRSRLMRLGLFWHFLDIVWIGIFSVVYLPGVMG